LGDITKIAWTNSTFNPWIGCTKVGIGCSACYAEAQDKRWHGGEHWGAGAPRRRTSVKLWRGPEDWDRMRAAGKLTRRRKGVDVPVPLWVFCASLADVFDNEIDPAWRADLWALIRRTPHLRWQLVTKRVGNVAKMLPDDWWRPDKYDGGEAYRHVGVIATVVNQEEYDRDVPKLVALKELGVRWIGLSVEPMLGPISLYSGGVPGTVPPYGPYALDWIICGGESAQGGARAREFRLEWAFWLRDQCAAHGIPFFMKQAGSEPVWGLRDRIPLTVTGPGTDPAEWPEGLRIRQMPRIYEGEKL
jgi:protein gp37